MTGLLKAFATSFFLSAFGRFRVPQRTRPGVLNLKRYRFGLRWQCMLD
jgi:hypothetical protein